MGLTDPSLMGLHAQEISQAREYLEVLEYHDYLWQGELRGPSCLTPRCVAHFTALGFIGDVSGCLHTRGRL
jgi:hypothetical protein